MIFYATNGQALPPPTVVVEEHQTYSSRIFSLQVADGPPIQPELVGEVGDSLELKPHLQDLVEEFDWNDAKIQKSFIRLEQKFLAKKATDEEIAQYKMMKRDRNEKVFADRQLRDYAEIQRLRMLAQKLADLQKYLRPVEI